MYAQNELNVHAISHEETAVSRRPWGYGGRGGGVGEGQVLAPGAVAAATTASVCHLKSRWRARLVGWCLTASAGNRYFLLDVQLETMHLWTVGVEVGVACGAGVRVTARAPDPEEDVLAGLLDTVGMWAKGAPGRRTDQLAWNRDSIIHRHPRGRQELSTGRHTPAENRKPSPHQDVMRRSVAPAEVTASPRSGRAAYQGQTASPARRWRHPGGIVVGWYLRS